MDNLKTIPACSAYGQALAVLHSLELTAILPEPEIPLEERSLVIHREKKDFVKPTLGAFPNPTNGITYISYPADADGVASIELYDEIGRTVSIHQLTGKGILELNMAKQPAGIYLIRLMLEGKAIAENKIVVTE